MHYHPRELENLVLIQRAFIQGVLKSSLLEAFGEWEKSLVYLVKEGMKIEGLGKQRHSVIGRGGKHSESVGHHFRIWSCLGDILSML